MNLIQPVLWDLGASVGWEAQTPSPSHMLFSKQQYSYKNFA